DALLGSSYSSIPYPPSIQLADRSSYRMPGQLYNLDLKLVSLLCRINLPRNMSFRILAGMKGSPYFIIDPACAGSFLPRLEAADQVGIGKNPGRVKHPVTAFFALQFA